MPNVRSSRPRPPLTAARWWLAHQLNRVPGFCWANLVSWALRSRRLTETRIDWICREDLRSNGCCYCQKLREGQGRAS